MAAWVAVGLFALGVSCQADVEVGLLSGDQEAAPGASCTSVFSILNAGIAELTALLQFEAPAGWQVLGAQESLALLPGEETSVFATVVIPAGTRPGAYEVSLTAVSESNPSDRSTAVVTLRVAPINELELMAPDGKGAAPGERLEYEITLVNHGNAQDSIILAASSSGGFAIALSESLFDLAPQERAAARVYLEIPTDAEPGQDALTLTAKSVLYDGAQDDATVFTTVLPPSPDTVSGTLMEVLPGRVRLSLNQDVFTGDFGSRLTLSLSGRVLDGFFSSFVSTENPFGPDPFDVTSYSILYRREPTTTTLGNLSKRLTDLVSLTCEGGSVEVDEELFDLIVVAGLSDDEARFGGRLAVGPEVANVGLTYFDARSPTARRAIAGATAESEPLEDWRILIEGALGTHDGLSSHAFLFGTEIDTEGYFLSGEAFSVGTDFPGSFSDSAGIRLSQRLRMSDLSLSLSISHVWDNVVRDPLLPTRIDDRLGLNVSATPIEDGPRFSSTVEFQWEREDDPLQMSEIALLLSTAVRETSGVFPYALSGEIADRIDRVLGTHSRTLTFSEGAGLSVDSFYLFLQLTQEKHVDVVNDLVLSGATDVSFLFRPEGTLHEATISLRNTGDSLDLSTSLFIAFLDGLDIIFDGTIGWDRADASPVSFGWGITFSADLQVPLPFLVTKGRVEGRLYVDVDADGTYGASDRPVIGGVVSADGAEVSTNRDGLFRFPPLSEGAYSLAVKRLPVDAAPPDAVEVHVAAGRSTVIEIPLRLVPVVDGVVFDDADQDGNRGADEGGFADVRVVLVGETGTVYAAVTDTLGQFAVVDVLPGRYTVALDPATLPPRFTPTTPEERILDIASARLEPIEFGAYIRPREVVVTFQPPTADFSFTPADPVVGESVTFDGTPSSDFDGQITSYAWDFDADGVVDSIASTAEWTFSVPGDTAASLTVTDNAGNRDTATRIINIGGGDDSAKIAASSILPPIADFSISPESPKVGEAVALDGTLSIDLDGEIVAYAWDFGADGTVDAASSAALRVFAAAGVYDVQLTVTDNAGNKDSLTRIVEVVEETTAPADVRPMLQPPTADFSYAPGQPVAGGPVIFDATPSTDFDGAIASFAWDFDADGLVDATGSIVEYVFPASGEHSVRLTVIDDDGASDTVAYIVDIVVAVPPDAGSGTFLPPIAEFSYAPDAPVAGEAVECNGMSSFDIDGEIVAYAWDFDGNGVFDASGPIVLHVYGAPGSYDARLTVTDDDGLTDTFTRTISVE